MTRIVTASGYTEADSGLFAAILVTCGTIGSIIVGVLCDRTKRYQLIIIIILVLDTGTYRKLILQ
jgi:cyanate permease